MFWPSSLSWPIFRFAGTLRCHLMKNGSSQILVSVKQISSIACWCQSCVTEFFFPKFLFNFHLNSSKLKVLWPQFRLSSIWVSTHLDLWLDCAQHFVCGFHLHLRIPLAYCKIYIQLRDPEQLAFVVCSWIRNKTKLPTKFTLQVLLRWNHGSSVSGIHLQFGTS